MEVVIVSETLAVFYQTTWLNILKTVIFDQNIAHVMYVILWIGLYVNENFIKCVQSLGNPKISAS